MDSAATVYRARSGPEIVDAGIQLGRSHYAELLVAACLALVVELPVMVLYAMAGGSQAEALPGGIPAWAVSGYTVFAAGWAWAVPIHMALRAYTGDAVDLATSLHAMWRSGWRVGIATLMFTVALMAGFVLLIAPGIIVLRRYALATSILVAEGGGVRAAFERSRTLTRGNENRVLVVVLGVTTISMMVTLAASALAPALGLARWDSLVSTAAGCVIGPFTAGVTVALYYDTRIRKEALDVELLVRDSGAAAEEAVPA